MNRPQDQDSPANQVLRLIGGKWIAAAVSTAAELGVPEALADGPRSLGALSDALECPEASLHRLLRVLVGEGLLRERVDETYELTELGEQLRDHALGPLARYIGSPAQWGPWSRLADAVRTGRSAFSLWHGEDLFEYLDARPDEADTYHRAVDAFTRWQARALAEAWEFEDASHIVDVGGGFGTLLVEVLARWPHLRATLYDRPSVVAAASEHLANSPESPDIRMVGGDFLESIPAGADVYVIKHVIHNWGDEDAARILRGCAEAAGPSGHVLVIEGIVLPGNRADATRLLDLEMLALCKGGYERSKPEFRRLFGRAGLRLQSAHPLAAGARLLVGRPTG